MKTLAKRNRVALRKEVDGIDVVDVRYGANLDTLAPQAKLVDVSSTGIMLQIHREELKPRKYRGSLSLEDLVGEPVCLEIDVMALEIDGMVTRTKNIGGGVYEIGIDYSAGTPEYWRECLVDLLPHPGEIAAEEEEYEDMDFEDHGHAWEEE
jgi:hypothetical protein